MEFVVDARTKINALISNASTKEEKEALNFYLVLLDNIEKGVVALSSKIKEKINLVFKLYGV